MLGAGVTTGDGVTGAFVIGAGVAGAGVTGAEVFVGSIGALVTGALVIGASVVGAGVTGGRVGMMLQPHSLAYGYSTGQKMGSIPPSSPIDSNSAQVMGPLPGTTAMASGTVMRAPSIPHTLQAGKPEIGLAVGAIGALEGSRVVGAGVTGDRVGKLDGDGEGMGEKVGGGGQFPQVSLQISQACPPGEQTSAATAGRIANQRQLKFEP